MRLTPNTVNLIKDSAYLIKHSGVLHPSKCNINSIHGINPRINFPLTGKSADLPRFITKEMSEARKFNQIATEQIKTPISRTFSKATGEDFIRLTDTSFEASNLRCTFTHPETKEVYHLLSEGKTPDGQNIVKVLDENGAYLKTINIKPKKIVIIDNYDQSLATTENGLISDWIKKVCHGDIVEIIAKRNNPFADYEIVNAAAKDNSGILLENVKTTLDNLQQRINNGETIDFISCSFGSEFEKKYLLEHAKSANLSPADIKHGISQTLENVLQKNERSMLNDFIKRNPNVRIICASGNDGAGSLSYALTSGNAEGVGALGSNAKITKYSSSRNSLYTQHYELGDFKITATPYGYSLTGGNSTEIPFTDEINKIILQQHGKKPKLMTEEQLKHIEDLKQKADENRTYEQLIFTRKPIRNEWDEQLDAYLDDLYINQGYLKKNDNFNSYNQVVSKTTEFLGIPLTISYPFTIDSSGNAMLKIDNIIKEQSIRGTSFATPTRSAKLALWESLKSLI